ncbi:hypothetical protein OESDEN_04127 [Oesophagostomum dentatum]|uniref:SHSP domain-containing protein n=1 Tax=Oesophagostomum dentatum TaxID=61180 RepID=A0A0B1TKH4_OESDE|nr:hypothetical protein OESDEN_04127 [Oesophagostomum dentatum]
MSIVTKNSKYWDWPLTNDDFVTVVDDATHFEVDLYAAPFRSEEIKVETIGDLVEIYLEHESSDADIMNASRKIMRQVL